MVIWILFAVVTTAATAALLHPLASSQCRRANGSAEASEVYREQLLELDRELGAGRIPQSEYEYARAEIARRLFKATDHITAERCTPPHTYRWLRLAIVVLLPVMSIGLYVGLGSPEMPSMPLRARVRDPSRDLAMLIEQTERHLARQPDDGRGWDVIAPVFLKVGRVDDAEKAYRNAVRILGPSVQRLDGLAESAMARSNGVVTEDTQGVLQQLLRLEPGNARARFYVALGLEQMQKTAQARKAFEELATQSPAAAPWIPLVNEHIASNGGVPVLPKAVPEVGPAANERSKAHDQRQMVHAMVKSLDAKLTANPDNPDGWLRLIRSNAALDEKSQAAEALRRGLAAFPVRGVQAARLVALGREFGIVMEGTTR